MTHLQLKTIDAIFSTEKNSKMDVFLNGVVYVKSNERQLKVKFQVFINKLHLSIIFRPLIDCYY